MPHMLPRWLRPCLALLLCPALASILHAQTLAFSEGVQTHASLSGTTATLSGKAELRLTGTTPLTGSVINLTSPDAWVLFTSIKPSAVVSTYLSQLRVNGATAVSGSNVRVVQHGQGAYVIPHAPSFQPLTGYTGRDFSGTSRTFAQYTYYNSATSLGALNLDLSSFKLKRGYMATFSTQTNGTGPSQIYIAQDADLEIGRLPSTLDNKIRYVRVLPWRWVSKKGACDVGPTTLNASWHYNWDNNQNSPLDWEYVPIRQQRWWPGYPTNKPDSTHLLGYNEPDNPVEDSYTSLGSGSVDTAIAVWPELLATGLRVGSPATTDGGLGWLYDFMTKADAAKLRVDYVAVHFYRCGFTASQLYDWLYDVHVRTGRPIWITEFNNGADWTTCTDPSYAQNASRIAEFIEMMDNAPWIERYAVYSRVEYMRQMTYDSGGLTPAGTAYRDNISPMAYTQRLPRTGARAVTQLNFDGDTLDSSGSGNNAAIGRPVFAPGRTGQALRLDGATQHVQLPADVASASSFSFAAWVYWDGGANWQRIFDLGRDSTRYMFLTPKVTSGVLRFAARNGGSEQIVQTDAALPVGQWSHVALTLSGGTARLYVNGVQSASGPVTITPAQLSADLNYLGKSRFSADPLFSGLLDDVRIADYAFTAEQITAMQGANTAPQFAAATLSGGTANQNVPFTGTLAGTANDPDTGDTLAYAKVSGPAWLQVAADGTLTGTPGFANDGLQEFVVSVTDSTGASDSAVLTITMPLVIGNGTWRSDLSGDWSDTAKWTSAFPANGSGASANFSTLDITADRTVTLDSSRAVGSLAFGDTSGTQNWTLASTDGASLTLDTASATSPTITVNQNTAVLSVPVGGTIGFTKAGTGTLVLTGGGSLAGTVNIDSNSTTVAQGVVRVAHPETLSNVSTIQIRNNNSGSSTLELSAALGDMASPAVVSLSGRNGTVPAVRHLSGFNALGGVSVQIGGSNYLLQSDSGALDIGTLTSGASGSRIVTFGGDGDFSLSGIASNGSATTGLSIVKNGPGRLTLAAAANTFTGNLTINGGTVSVLGAASLYASAWNTTAILTVNTGGTLELDRWGYGITDAAYRTQALGGLSYNPARLVLNGGTLRFSGGAAGAPENPAEQPYGPGFTIGAAGATLEAAKADDTWTVKNDSRGGGAIVSTAGGTLTLSGLGHGIFDKVLPGTGGLVKTGTGTWTLPLTSTYTGPTTVNAGTLLVTGAISTGAVTVNTGGTLGGTGSIGGPVTVQSGGTLAPGANGIGTLTLGGNLNLLPGSVLRLELDRTAATRDQLAVTGALTLGGAFELTNLNGTFAAGDSFALITAGSRSGAFTATTLPALPSTLTWDTSTLATDGVLRVLAVPGFADWAEQHTLPPGAVSFDADADNDGLHNGLEWLLGGNPAAADATARLPQIAKRTLTTAEYPAAIEGRTYLTLTTRLRRVHPGVTVIPEAATTLATLGNPESVAAAIRLGEPVADGDFDVVTHLFTTPLEDSPTGTGFLRLRATLN